MMVLGVGDHRIEDRQTYCNSSSEHECVYQILRESIQKLRYSPKNVNLLLVQQEKSGGPQSH